MLDQAIVGLLAEAGISLDALSFQNLKRVLKVDRVTGLKAIALGAGLMTLRKVWEERKRQALQAQQDRLQQEQERQRDEYS